MDTPHRPCRLRTVRPEDAELLLRWENDPAVWEVSETTRPFSREEIERFIAEQQAGIHACGQQRFMIENDRGEPVGAIDLFEFDPGNGEASVGILIHEQQHRRKGYASGALAALETHARTALRLERLWCNIFSDNEASLALFRSAGFRETAPHPQANDAPSGGRTILRFQKRL